MLISGKKLGRIDGNSKIVTGIIKVGNTIVKKEIYVTKRPVKKNVIFNKRINKG